ncbi:MAG: hypothetical protein Q7J64_01095, partial [Elusimicrobiota bacterium]|nr:hypothetical protein [Elusimicrobiota bacterium]
ACVFSLAWPAEGSTATLAASAAALAALAAVQPAVFCSAALVLLVLSLRPGLGRSAMGWSQWFALWLLLAATAFPEISDPLLRALLPDLWPRFDVRPVWPWLCAAASVLLLYSKRRFLWPLRNCSAFLTGRPRRSAGAWRGVVLYGFFVVTSTPREAALVGFVTLAGWLLFDVVRFKTALWRGMAATALALLSYLASGGWLDLSHISVAQAYRFLDAAYSLPALIVLTLLKQASALTLPLLPLMARRPAAEAACAGPVFGALAAGSAVSLWVSRFVQEIARTPLGGEPAFERLIWCAMAGWLLAGVWMLARARLWPSPRRAAR